MAASIITFERLHDLLEYSPDTGHLFWKADGRKHRAGHRAGGAGHSAGYRSLQINKRKYLEHRLIYFYVTGDWPPIIDHVNGDRTDNRWANLRSATDHTNSQNIRAASKNNKLGVLGVHWDDSRKKFHSKIYAHGKPIYLGRYETIDEAHAVYLLAKRALHDGCTI